MTQITAIKVGDRFTRVVVTGHGGRRPDAVCGARLFALVCDCGNNPKPATAAALRSGAVRSCGCLAKEKFIARATKHGHAANDKKSPELTAWQHMKTRCYDQNSKAYAGYGGRGIIVADVWRDDFAAFLRDLGHRPTKQHSIDRINVDGNYEPGNVRWATTKEQGRNKRNSILFTFEGHTYHLHDLCDMSHTTYQAALYRLKRKKPIREVFAENYEELIAALSAKNH